MRKATFFIGFIMLTVIALTSSVSENINTKKPKAFKHVKIGKQIWMIENLNTDTFRNGDPIPHVKTNEGWKKANKEEKPAWCYYENDSTNGKMYGKLYNWYAVNDPRGLAPFGWKVPTHDDWTTLTDKLGGESYAGKKLKYTDHWDDCGGKSRKGNGNNKSGFAGLPGGVRMYDKSHGMGHIGFWWSSSSTEEKVNRALFHSLVCHYDGVPNKNIIDRGTGLSVRCLLD